MRAFWKSNPQGPTPQGHQLLSCIKFLSALAWGGKMFLWKNFSSHGSTFGSNISPWWRGDEAKWMGPPLKPMPWAFQISNTHLVTPHQGHVMWASRSRVSQKNKGGSRILMHRDTRILMQSSVRTTFGLGPKKTCVFGQNTKEKTKKNSGAFGAAKWHS